MICAQRLPFQNIQIRERVLLHSLWNPNIFWIINLSYFCLFHQFVHSINSQNENRRIRKEIKLKWEKWIVKYESWDYLCSIAPKSLAVSPDWWHISARWNKLCPMVLDKHPCIAKQIESNHHSINARACMHKAIDTTSFKWTHIDHYIGNNQIDYNLQDTPFHYYGIIKQLKQLHT